MALRKDFRMEVIDRAVRLFERDADRLGFARLPDLFPKGAQGKNGRTELRVEHRDDRWSNKMMFEDFAHNGGYVVNRAADFKFFNQTAGARLAGKFRLSLLNLHRDPILSLRFQTSNIANGVESKIKRRIMIHTDPNRSRPVAPNLKGHTDYSRISISLK